MIDTKYFANYITGLLNTYGENYGVQFKVYADEAGLKEDLKEYGSLPQHYTSGIATITNTQLLPIRGLKLNTYTVEVELFVDIMREGLTDGESVNLNNVRSAVVGMVEGLNGTTGATTIDGVSYSQSVTVGYPTTGTKGDVGFIADCLPLFLTFNIALFQEGLNANDCKLWVNGEEVPFTSLVLTRNKTAESATFNGETETSTIVQMNGLSIDGVLPARRNDTLSNLLMQDVLSGSNYALSVILETPTTTRTFIGTFGNTVASLDIATNVGYNFSIVKGNADVLDYNYEGSEWNEKTSTQLSVILRLPAEEGITHYFVQCTGKKSQIFWNPIGETSTRFTTSTLGAYTMKIAPVLETQTLTGTDVTFTSTTEALGGRTYYVCWGDDTFDTFNPLLDDTITATHTYTEGGEHTVSLARLDDEYTEQPRYCFGVSKAGGGVATLYWSNGDTEVKKIEEAYPLSIVDKPANGATEMTLRSCGMNVGYYYPISTWEDA